MKGSLDVLSPLCFSSGCKAFSTKPVNSRINTSYKADQDNIYKFGAEILGHAGIKHYSQTRKS